MNRIAIVDNNSFYTNLIIQEIKNNNYLKSRKLHTYDNFDLFHNDINNWLDENDLVDIIISYDIILFKQVQKIIGLSMSKNVRVFVITDLDYKFIKYELFIESVDYLLLIRNRETKMFEKLVNSLSINVSLSNRIKDSNIMSHEKYLDKVLTAICMNKKLIGYNYLYTACEECILNPEKITWKTKDLYTSISEKVFADNEAIDRSIRNFIRKGEKTDNLQKFLEFTNTSFNTYKLSNTNIIRIIALNYLDSNNVIIN